MISSDLSRPRALAFTTLACLTLVGSSAATSGATESTARAAVSIDCTTGPVSLTESNTSYVLTGACSGVQVTGDNILVDLASATTLQVDAGNTTITAETLGRVVLLGANNTVRADSITWAKTGTGNQTLVVAGKVRTVVMAAATSQVRAAKAERVKIQGSNNSVKITTVGRLSVKGSNNSARTTRLASVLVRGANNAVRATKGSTKVDVRGPNNVIRVNRRR